MFKNFKDPEGDTKTYMQMFIMALYMYPKNWKPPKCPSADEWLNKLWYLHTTEYYSTIRRDELVKYIATWMNLKHLMRSQRPSLKGYILYESLYKKF